MHPANGGGYHTTNITTFTITVKPKIDAENSAMEPKFWTISEVNGMSQIVGMKVHPNTPSSVVYGGLQQFCKIEVDNISAAQEQTRQQMIEQDKRMYALYNRDAIWVQKHHTDVTLSVIVERLSFEGDVIPNDSTWIKEGIRNGEDFQASGSIKNEVSVSTTIVRNPDFCCNIL